MGLFYKTPSDLADLERIVLEVGQQMALAGRGQANPGLLEELTSEAIVRMGVERSRLVREVRGKDLKAFRKHLLSVGRYMDNAPYNQLYAPFVRDHLAD